VEGARRLREHGNPEYNSGGGGRGEVEFRLGPPRRSV